MAKADDLLDGFKSPKDFALEIKKGADEEKECGVRVLISLQATQAGALLLDDVLKEIQEAYLARYRFEPFVREFQCTTNRDLAAAIMQFVNGAIDSTEDELDRTRLRNELIGLNLSTVLKKFRAEPVSDALSAEIDKFAADSSIGFVKPSTDVPLDLASHEDVFRAVLRQLDPSGAFTDRIWELAEKLVSKAVSVQTREDVNRLSYLCRRCTSDFTQGLSRSVTCDCHCHKGPPQPESGIQTPPPVPPPLPPEMAPPPPPPILLGCQPTTSADAALPQQNVPSPKTRVKTLAWTKVPASRVMENGECIWKNAAASIKSRAGMIDFSVLEKWFQNDRPGNSAHTDEDSPGTLRRKDSAARRPENSEIVLLDPRRSFNINIFLATLGGPDRVLSIINECKSTEMNLEQMKNLAKMLPEIDNMLESLKDPGLDESRLATVEKFFTRLIRIPSYKMRIETMLIQEEFGAGLDYFKPSVRLLVQAATDVRSSKRLQDVLCLVLLAGNFLNKGSYSGNAAGFKLSSLPKLLDFKATRAKSTFTLLDFVAMEAQRNDPSLKSLPQELRHLEDASKLSCETIRNDFTQLRNRTEHLATTLDEENSEFKARMKPFFEIARAEFAVLAAELEQVEGLREDLAAFFCDDPASFKLEDCFRTIAVFLTSFGKAITNFEERQKQEEKRTQRETEKKLRRQSIHGVFDTSSVDNITIPMYFVKEPPREETVTTAANDTLVRGISVDSDIARHGGRRRTSGRAVLERLPANSRDRPRWREVVNQQCVRDGIREPYSEFGSTSQLSHLASVTDSESRVPLSATQSYDSLDTVPGPQSLLSTLQRRDTSILRERVRASSNNRSEKSRSCVIFDPNAEDLDQYLDTAETVHPRVIGRRSMVRPKEHAFTPIHDTANQLRETSALPEYDEAFRYCEKAKAEIESINWKSGQLRSLRDSGIEDGSSISPKAEETRPTTSTPPTRPSIPAAKAEVDDGFVDGDSSATDRYSSIDSKRSERSLPPSTATKTGVRSSAPTNRDKRSVLQQKPAASQVQKSKAAVSLAERASPSSRPSRFPLVSSPRTSPSEATTGEKPVRKGGATNKVADINKPNRVPTKQTATPTPRSSAVGSRPNSTGIRAKASPVPTPTHDRSTTRTPISKPSTPAPATVRPRKSSKARKPVRPVDPSSSDSDTPAGKNNSPRKPAKASPSPKPSTPTVATPKAVSTIKSKNVSRTNPRAPTPTNLGNPSPARKQPQKPPGFGGSSGRDPYGSRMGNPLLMRGRR